MIKERIIHWGDCAPSGAVYYPVYYRWFDEAAWEFFAEHNLAMGALGERYGVVGMPLASCRAEFRLPCRLGDRLGLDTALAAYDTSSITLSHFVYNRDELAVRGEEIRFWGARDEAKSLEGRAIPAEIADKLALLVRPAAEQRLWPER